MTEILNSLFSQLLTHVSDVVDSGGGRGRVSKRMINVALDLP